MLEFPEEALEAIAAECEQTAKDWTGDGSKRGRVEIAAKWTRKAAVIRHAIDVHRAATNREPITRRQKFAALVDGLVEGMTPRSQPVPRPAERIARPVMKPAPALERHDAKAKAAGE